MWRLLFLIPFLAISGMRPAFPQEAKATSGAAGRIKSVSELETDLRDRKAKPVEKSYTLYDIKGNLLEIIERDDAGVVTLHEKYEYNEAGEKTIEIQYEENGKIRKRHVYQYENHLRVKRLTYDEKGKLIGEKQYVYEFHRN